jgi:hypothetical protein
VDDFIANNPNSPLTLELINDHKEKTKPNYSNSGLLILKHCSFNQLTPPPKTVNFLDYIKGGCKLNLMFAIDFSVGNGSAEEKESLHYLGAKDPNSYLEAMQMVGKIVQPYVRHRLIPIWGFGANWKNPSEEFDPDCFPLNQDDNFPEAKGMEETMQLYKDAVPQLKFGGPRNFSKVITAAMDFVKCSQEQQSYGVLVMLTCGVNADYDKVEKMLEQVSKSPISVVVIGIGKADFRKLKLLDGDWYSRMETDPVSSIHCVEHVCLMIASQRDVISFTVFNHEMRHHIPETLQEIPRQLLKYMMVSTLQPNSPLEPAPKPDSFNLTE